MNEQIKEFLRVIKLLHDNGCMKHLIIIGTWAEYVYQASGLLSNFTFDQRTDDCDFLCKNLRLPNPKINLVEILEREGYVIDPDIIHEACKIFSPAGLELEFLLGKKGAGNEITLKSNFGFYVITLRNVDILKRNAVKVNLMGMDIEVPKPEAYVIQKMIIHLSRGEKTGRDLRSIKGLWSQLDKTEFWEICNSLSVKQQKIVKKFIETHDLENN